MEKKQSIIMFYVEEGMLVAERKLKRLWLLVILAIGIIVYIAPFAICIYEFYKGGNEKYIVYMGSAIFLSVQIFLKAKEKKWFGLNTMDWFFLTNFVGFLVAVYFIAQFGAHIDKEKAFPGKYLKKSATVVVYEFKTNDVPEKFRHIGSTSQFMFLFDHEENCTLVVPISDFVKAKINLQENSD